MLPVSVWLLRVPGSAYAKLSGSSTTMPPVDRSAHPQGGADKRRQTRGDSARRPVRSFPCLPPVGDRVNHGSPVSPRLTMSAAVANGRVTIRNGDIDGT